MASACTEKGCSAGATNVCSYTDRNGRSCGTAWCEAHVRLLGGEAYCRRHASTLAALRTLGTPIDENAQLPALDNRGASLLRWMAKDLDATIRELLTQRAPAFGDDLSARGSTQTESGRSIWTWNWKDDRSGMVTLAVDEARDDTVDVLVNGTKVFSEKPPWVNHHQKGEFNVDPIMDSHERQAYTRQIINAIAAALGTAK